MGAVIGIMLSSVFNLLGRNQAVNYQAAKYLHSACRSCDKNALKAYQSKFDNLPNEELVYVSYDDKYFDKKNYFCNINWSNIKRTFVPDDKVPWSVDWPEYKPVEYTSLKVKEKPVWADPDDVALITNWNKLDGKIDRRSFTGDYKILNKMPLNPSGRTGIRGRGQLGKWAVNHAADPIVTR